MNFHYDMDSRASFRERIIHANRKLSIQYSIILYIKRGKLDWNMYVWYKSESDFQFPVEFKTVCVISQDITVSFEERAIRVTNQYKSIISKHRYHSLLYEIKTNKHTSATKIFPPQSSSIFIKLCINIYTRALFIFIVI